MFFSQEPRVLYFSEEFSPKYTVATDTPKTPKVTQEKVNADLHKFKDLKESSDISAENRNVLKEVLSDMHLSTADALKLLKMFKAEGVVNVSTGREKYGAIFVLALQQTLTYLGIFDKNRDGIWGEETNAAVKIFQKAAVVDSQIYTNKQDGLIGPETFSALIEALEMNNIGGSSSSASGVPNIPNGSYASTFDLSSHAKNSIPQNNNNVAIEKGVEVIDANGATEIQLDGVLRYLHSNGLYYIEKEHGATEKIVPLNPYESEPEIIESSNVILKGYEEAWKKMELEYDEKFSTEKSTKTSEYYNFLLSAVSLSEKVNTHPDIYNKLVWFAVQTHSKLSDVEKYAMPLEASNDVNIHDTLMRYYEITGNINQSKIFAQKIIDNKGKDVKEKDKQKAAEILNGVDNVTKEVVEKSYEEKKKDFEYERDNIATSDDVNAEVQKVDKSPKKVVSKDKDHLSSTERINYDKFDPKFSEFIIQNKNALEVFGVKISNNGLESNSSEDALIVVRNGSAVSRALSFSKNFNLEYLDMQIISQTKVVFTFRKKGKPTERVTLLRNASVEDAYKQSINTQINGVLAKGVRIGQEYEEVKAIKVTQVGETGVVMFVLNGEPRIFGDFDMAAGSIEDFISSKLNFVMIGGEKTKKTLKNEKKNAEIDKANQKDAEFKAKKFGEYREKYQQSLYSRISTYVKEKQSGSIIDFTNDLILHGGSNASSLEVGEDFTVTSESGIIEKFSAIQFVKNGEESVFIKKGSDGRIHKVFPASSENNGSYFSSSV